MEKKGSCVKLKFCIERYKEKTRHDEAKGLLQYLDGCYVTFIDDEKYAIVPVGLDTVRIKREWCIKIK